MTLIRKSASFENNGVLSDEVLEAAHLEKRTKTR